MKWRAIAVLLVVGMLLTACGRQPEAQTLQPEGVKIDLGRLDADEAVLRAAGVTLGGEIVYYPDGTDFTFGEGTAADMHSKEEAAAHRLVTITKPGTYILSGTLEAGQVAVDLGKDAKDDPDAVVTLILNGVDLTCTIAPAVIFYNVYECGGETAPELLDLSAAGAKVRIADGTVNHIRGSYVARIYKSYTLSDDGTRVVDSKKLHKYDGAFYSRASMSVSGGEKGNGVLNIEAENEGLDSELHLEINSGVLNIRAGNDGINTNEDNISVCAIHGGTVYITVTGQTGEGDGIDSNGYIYIDGGTVRSYACSTSIDSGLDSDCGTIVAGGDVIATGNMYDAIESRQTGAVFFFESRQTGGTFRLEDENGEVAASFDAESGFQQLYFSNDRLAPGMVYSLTKDGQACAVAEGGGQMGGPGMGQLPDGVAPPELPEGRPPEGPMPEQPGGPMPELPEGQIPEGGKPPDLGGPQGPMAPPDMGSDHQPATVGAYAQTFTFQDGLNLFTVK